jgi:exopolysaccharide production protein ExoQ
MSTSVATCIYLGFVILLLRSDTKYTRQVVSSGLWVPVIWLWLITSRPLGYWLGGYYGAGPNIDVTEGSFYDRTAQLVLIGLGIIILARRGIVWNNVFAGNGWVWIFSLFCLVSTIWSPLPFVAFKRWIRDVGSIEMILIVLTEENPTLAVRTLFLRCAYALIPLSVLFIKYYPTIGRYYNEWTGEAVYCGITINKNTLGVLAMVSVFFLTWSIVDIRKRPSAIQTIKAAWPELLVLLMCAWIFKIVDSKTSLASLIIGLVVFGVARTAWISADLGRMKWILWSLLVVSFLVFYNSGLRAEFAQSFGRDATLTTRTDIWEDALELKTNPIVGAGFSSVWLTERGAALVLQMGGLAHSHNGYLETYLNTGIIGLAMLITILVAAGKNSLAELSSGTLLGHIFPALFISGVIYNYTEVTFNNENIVGFALWLIAMRLCVQDNSGATEEHEEDLLLPSAESVPAYIE